MPISLICEHCQSVKRVPPSRTKTFRFCSNECRNAFMNSRTTRWCNHCKSEKPLSRFGLSADRPQGRAYTCKECICETSKDYQARNTTAIRKRKHLYMLKHQTEKRIYNQRYYIEHRDLIREQAREYFATHPRPSPYWQNPEQYKAGARRRREQKPLEAKASAKLGRAIASGQIIRPKTCEDCEQEKRLDGHHDDYSKPLEVKWLCRSCHQLLHSRQKEINIEL